MSDPQRVLFLADAGPTVGGGHVMRCLTLARALTSRGAECAFVESRAAAPILRRFGWPQQTLLALVATENLSDLLQYAGDFAGRFEPDIVVTDHYGVDGSHETALAWAGQRRVVAIDDLADRPHNCDLVVDPGYGRKADAYAGLVAARTRVLAGPSYALVRPEFASARQRAMSRRAKHGRIGRALVSLGLTDVGAVTGRVVQALQPMLGDVRLDVVIGAGTPSIEALSALAASDRRIHLWIDTAEMASLMADCDIAIGAGGSSVWERATVGLPSATVILAENQRPMIERMAAMGFTLALDVAAGDFEAQLAQAWQVLIADTPTRWRLAEASSELCDGQGAERVAEAVLGL
ncbi:MAG TPA: UDP-2,4-diacetamido-2,4,6-trideoxy-beta-L-altropyranose hydrolase [Caulobacteraceae bacterium]|nr:UDP-2,4-diacetamido-2,4,6-trideoxy-beta-L-altropyranose hydrolase [Caulobacteraceae bacterium]